MTAQAANGDHTARPATRYAVVVVTDDAGRVLLLRRAPGRAAGGRWGLPGGHVDAGETTADAAARELREELGPGAKVTLREPAAAVATRFDGRPAEVTVFPARWHGGEIALDHEHTDMAWVAAPAARELPLVPGVLEDLRLVGLLPGER